MTDYVKHVRELGVMRTHKLWVFVPLLFILSGCSQAGNHVADPGGSYPEGIVFNHQFYDANTTGISTVGKQVGQVTQLVNQMLTQSENGTVSNSYPVGTKIYEVPGKDVSQAIAIQDSNGKYLEIEADPHS